MRNYVLDPKTLPVEFSIGEQKYIGMPDGCVTVRDGNKITYTSYVGGVEVRAECVVYDDFDASEWTLYFTNKGKEKAPVLNYVYAIKTDFEGENCKIISCNGDYCSADGYSTAETFLNVGMEMRQRPQSGRGTDRAFPYYRLLHGKGGINIAVGWPGQWESCFKGLEDGVQFWASQCESEEGFNIALNPGEMIRTALIVTVSFDGDLEKGINVWRRWYLKYVGTAKPYITCSYAPPGTIEYTNATEENQLEHMIKVREHGIDVNLWWLDAGWYYAKNDRGEDDWWITVGDWRPDKKRFPNGLAPIGEEAEKLNMDFLLWFEAERVTDHSPVYLEHPEWVIVNEEDPNVKMLDISIPECCDYLIKTVGDVIEESKVKIYRQDYNFDPKQTWRQGEAEDRRGMRENLYIQAYLRFWDSLKARFPHLLIDSCASGGRRNDIETMRRSVPMHQTDYCYGNIPLQQGFYQTLYTWIPYFRGFNLCDERVDGTYDYRSDSPYIPWKHDDEFRILCSFAPMLTMVNFSADDVTEDEYENGRKYIELYKKIAPTVCTGDFYALTKFHKSRFKWTSWQFDKPEDGKGYIQVIRNNSAPDDTLTVRPRLADGTYTFRNVLTNETFTYNGGEVTFAQPKRSVTFWEYCKN